ncbi:hypothetical protein [Nitrosovibrio tenuis]|uniref:Uncharacterized protein n=1 Tax=Nitrosovibrio tenuis TaxID=1233 RepID=A0A1H7IF93_9PROT|nr:hypothetical protein [Nitrosovibrio tenuis]SEK61166.1 hypothetical protein SAMN05216387_102154 [Nitrosovibrio tenuis]
MKKSPLIDLFGLSEDPLDNNRLDELFYRLELEIITSNSMPDNALFDPERQVIDSFIII